MSGATAPERPTETKVARPLRPLLATRSGTFHLDGAFAHAVSRLALGLGGAGRDHVLVRTRDAAVIAEADVVCVGQADEEAERGGAAIQRVVSLLPGPDAAQLHEHHLTLPRRWLPAAGGAEGGPCARSWIGSGASPTGSASAPPGCGSACAARRADHKRR